MVTGLRSHTAALSLLLWIEIGKGSDGDPAYEDKYSDDYV
jgi:hypothetical protein